MFIPIVAIAWLYVAVMMAVAEATSTQGSVLGAIFTFLLYGALPIALVMYVMATPARKRARKAREAAEEAEAAAQAAARAMPSQESSKAGAAAAMSDSAATEEADAGASDAPDQRGETPAGRTVAAERKES